MKVVLGLVFACLLFPGFAAGAVRTAASCSRADVAAAVNSAVDGDTIVIPAGTCTWTTNLTISNKILTLQGAGMNLTTIIDGVSKENFPNVPQVLTYRTKAGGLTRITGITFQGGSIVDNYNKGMVWIDGNSHQFRMDRVRIRTTRTSGVHLRGNVLGVLDHNVFELNDWGFGIYVHLESWNGTGDFGDSSWADAAPLGTDKAVFVEDNHFTSDTRSVAIDGWSGSRVVFRHNTLHNSAFENHGTETAGRWRSQRSFEVYNNTITFDRMSWASMIGIRGGTGVIYNNTGTITGSGHTNVIADLNNLRSSDPGRNYSPWGDCNGANVWDGNQGSSGYPCLDQPGRGRGDMLSGFSPSPVRWPNQTLDPVYGWNNTLNGKPSNIASNAPGVVVANRDYFNSVKPGYVPYMYPHPLVSGGGAPPPAPAPGAPSGLKIVPGAGS